MASSADHIALPDHVWDSIAKLINGFVLIARGEADARFRQEIESAAKERCESAEVVDRLVQLANRLTAGERRH